MKSFNFESDFLVEQIDNYLFLFAITQNASLKHNKELVENLREKKFKGEILVDMLLRVGANNERFYSCFFNGENFDMKTTKALKGKDSKKLFERLFQFEKKLCNENIDLLDSSILTYTEKLQILN